VKKFTCSYAVDSAKVSQAMDKTLQVETNSIIGSVMVIGGGIAGMQAALDLADSGYKVYLVEKGPAIGGVMAQLDKTFPTNDCSM
jgi:heterodisulfide reductase subunit A-like polyferredoxin